MTKEKILKTKFDLKDPYLLSKIVDGYISKIIGEENNIKTLFCACISKDLPRENRISVIIASQSSAGKSNLVNNVLEPFKEDTIDYTDFTSAFLKRTETVLNGKILKIEQMEKTNEYRQITMSNTKFLLSEGKLKTGLVDRNEKNQNMPKTLVVTGIPVFISTSTNFNFDPETLNRTFLMEIDESEEQTKRIVNYQLKKYSTLKIYDKWESELKELTNLAKLYKTIAHQITQIIIPFAHKIENRIPIHDITIRRDLQKILNLTSVIAFLHCGNRMRVQDNDGSDFIKDQYGKTEKHYTYSLIAEPSDFKEALEIAGKTIKQTLNKLNDSSMQVYSKFVELYKDNNKDSSDYQGIKVKDMAKALRKSDNRTRELLNQLWSSGFLGRDDKGKTNLYYPTEKQFEDIKTDDIEYSKEELIDQIKEQIVDSSKFSILYPDGRAIVT